MIEANPDLFYEACLFGWGAAGPRDFDAEQLAAYRASWRDPEAIAGGCNDYRATLAVDLAEDLVDHGKRISVPVLILYGASGVMAKFYDLPATWADRCTTMEARAIKGGHFFPDSAPGDVAEHVAAFLRQHPLPKASA